MPDIKDLLDIDIIVRDSRWEAAVENVVDISREAACAAFAVGVSRPLSAEAALVLADDEFIATLNKQYRGRDGATNVLSFAATDSDDPSMDLGQPIQDGVPVMLGDIIVAYETAVREADESGISAEHHLRHLVVHGTLHLLGYDHMTDDEAAEMEPLETQILGAMNVADPYDEDSGHAEEARP
ncbi:MAG: rRNA maturation RNase YbeY [Rhodospirillales bacterium]|nr:rRNA maturation RNase YbeY [Rhodospirillales bacterium]